MMRTCSIILMSAVFACLPNRSLGTPSSATPALPIGMYNSDFVPRPLMFGNDECPDVHQVPLKNNQILAELLLLCKALQLGGINSGFDFKNIPDYLRILNSAADATTVMPGFAIWRKDINPELFYISSPLLNDRDFVKGIYTVATHKKLLDVKKSEALKNFTVASNQNWVHDNTELACIQVKISTAAFNPFSMARMVAAGRADFLLFPFFNSPDLSGSLADIRLVPLPGFKVAFNDSLHFIVSKKHPRGQEVFDALQKGLEILHTDGTVHYAYEQLGFFNPTVNDWVKLGCEKSTP